MTSSATQNWFALLVGVDMYHGDSSRKFSDGKPVSLSHLQGATNDVKTIETILRDRFQFNDFTLLTSSPSPDDPSICSESEDKRPTHANIKKAFFDIYKKARSGDVFFFHFSGHGALLLTTTSSPADGRLHEPSLMTVDYGLGKPAVRGWELNEWLHQFSDKSVRVIVLLDSCYSGGAWRSDIRFRSPENWTPPPNLPADEVSAQGTQRKPAHRDGDLGVCWDINPKNFTLMAACQSTEKAAEKDEGGLAQGAFTLALMKYFQNSSNASNSTYRVVRDHAADHLSLWDLSQNPQVFGRDRLAFLRDYEPFLAIPVIATLENGIFSLPLGDMHGIKRGAEFITTLAKPDLIVSITEVEDHKSKANIKEGFVQDPSRPVELIPYRWSANETFEVAIDPRLGHKFSETLRHELQKRIAGDIQYSENVTLVEYGDSKAICFRLRMNEAGGIDILGPKQLVGDQERVRGWKYEGKSDSEKAGDSARAIAHLFRFGQILDLRGQCHDSAPFEVAIDSVDGSNDGIIRYVFQNNKDEVLHFAVLVLGPGFHVKQLFPAYDAFALVFGGEKRSFRAELTVPEKLRLSEVEGQNYEYCYIIRTVVVRDKNLSLKSMELPYIWNADQWDQPKGGRLERRDGGGRLLEDVSWWIDDQKLTSRLLKARFREGDEVLQKSTTKGENNAFTIYAARNSPHGWSEYQLKEFYTNKVRWAWVKEKDLRAGGDHVNTGKPRSRYSEVPASNATDVTATRRDANYAANYAAIHDHSVNTEKTPREPGRVYEQRRGRPSAVRKDNDGTHAKRLHSGSSPRDATESPTVWTSPVEDLIASLDIDEDASEGIADDRDGAIMRSIARSIPKTSASSAHMGFTFSTNCDIRAFVSQHYGTDFKDLRHMLAITGNCCNAQLTTVGLFFLQTWPNFSDILLDKLHRALSYATDDGNSNKHSMAYDCRVSIADKSIVVQVLGSRDMVCAIGQQLAWLGASCKASLGGLQYCHTILGANPQRPKLSVDYKITPFGKNVPELCWHRLIGDMVVVTGFPIPSRPEQVVGLQLPLEIMARLGRVLLVECLESGIVLKGDTGSFDFFPVLRSGEHVQWHLTSSARSTMLDEEEDSSPGLNLQELRIEELATTIACLGWTPDVVNNVGTSEIALKKIKPSSSRPVSECSIGPTGFQLSISKLIGLSIPFTVATTQFAPSVQKLELYDENLRDLAERNVILYDTQTRRGWLITAERVALQIILHRQEAGQFGHDVTLSLTDAGRDVRSVMIANAQKILRKDLNIENMEEKNVYFALEVRKIREKLVQLALAAQVEYRRLRQSIGPRGKVIGFEYLDMIRAPETAKPLMEDLSKSNGEWAKIAHSELFATVLFAKNFQEILLPKQDNILCLPYRRLPCHNSYLAAEAEHVQRMITNHTLSLPDTRPLYPKCTQPKDETIPCSCVRVRTLQRGTDTSRQICHELRAQSGALIFGDKVSVLGSRVNGSRRDLDAVSSLVMSPVWGTDWSS